MTAPDADTEFAELYNVETWAVTIRSPDVVAATASTANKAPHDERAQLASRRGTKNPDCGREAEFRDIALFIERGDGSFHFFLRAA
jgi:hypothetical protein